VSRADLLIWDPLLQGEKTIQSIVRWVERRSTFLTKQTYPDSLFRERKIHLTLSTSSLIWSGLQTLDTSWCSLDIFWTFFFSHRPFQIRLISLLCFTSKWSFITWAMRSSLSARTSFFLPRVSHIDWSVSLFLPRWLHCISCRSIFFSRLQYRLIRIMSWSRELMQKRIQFFFQ
jgi:hypothetical protein